MDLRAFTPEQQKVILTLLEDIERLKVYVYTDRTQLINLARQLRLAVVQNQYDAGNLTEDQARELLSGPLTPDDPSTVFDDSGLLRLNL